MVFAHILNINTCKKGVMNIFNNLLSISRGQNPSPSPTVVCEPSLSLPLLPLQPLRSTDERNDEYKGETFDMLQRF